MIPVEAIRRGDRGRYAGGVEPDALFLRTCDELAERLASGTEYDILMGAALIRKLLIDGDSLLHQVNRSRRAKILFDVNGPTPYEDLVLSHGPVFWTIEDGLDPDIQGPPGLKNRLSLKLDGFLKRRVMVVQAHTITVHDLVVQLANIEGGVHAGQANTDKEQALKDLARSFFIGNLPGGVRLTGSIGRIVLRGLQPLRETVASG